MKIKRMKISLNFIVKTYLDFILVRSSKNETVLSLYGEPARFTFEC